MNIDCQYHLQYFYFVSYVYEICFCKDGFAPFTFVVNNIFAQQKLLLLQSPLLEFGNCDLCSELSWTHLQFKYRCKETRILSFTENLNIYIYIYTFVINYCNLSRKIWTKTNLKKARRKMAFFLVYHSQKVCTLENPFLTDVPPISYIDTSLSHPFHVCNNKNLYYSCFLGNNPKEMICTFSFLHLSSPDVLFSLPRNPVIFFTTPILFCHSRAISTLSISPIIDSLIVLCPICSTASWFSLKIPTVISNIGFNPSVVVAVHFIFRTKEQKDHLEFLISLKKGAILVKLCLQWKYSKSERDNSKTF